MTVPSLLLRHFAHPVPQFFMLSNISEVAVILDLEALQFQNEATHLTRNTNVWSTEEGYSVPHL